MEIANQLLSIVINVVRGTPAMKKIALLLIISLPFAQRLDPVDSAMDELRLIVETASRASQRVFVDDFTGLL